MTGPDVRGDEPSRPQGRSTRYARVERPQLTAREHVAERWRLVLLLGAVGGLVLALAPSALALVGAAVAASVAAWARAGSGVVLAAALAVLAGVTAGDLRLAAHDRTALSSLLGREVTEVVEVLGPPRPSAFGATATVRLRGEPVLLRAEVWCSPGPCARQEPAAGALLRVRGTLRAPSAFARARGAHAELRADEVVGAGRRGGWWAVLDGVRGRAQAGLEARVPPDEGALLRGMVLGDDSALSEQRRDELRAAGLGHLVAASGQNVALLAALGIAACGLLGVPFRTRMAVVLGLVLLYVPLAGAGPSIQRAGVMAAAVLVATIAGQGASRWYALGLAALATLLLDPRAATDPGWQLSFAAVTGLLLLARPARDALRERGVGPGLAEAVAVTAVASTVTAPVAAGHFGTVSLAALPANVLAAPAVAPITWLGMLGAVGAQLDPLLATPFAWLAAPLLAFVLLVGETAAALPHAVVGPATGALVALTLGALLLPRRRAPVTGRREEEAASAAARGPDALAARAAGRQEDARSVARAADQPATCAGMRDADPTTAAARGAPALATAPGPREPADADGAGAPAPHRPAVVRWWRRWAEAAVVVGTLGLGLAGGVAAWPVGVALAVRRRLVPAVLVLAAAGVAHAQATRPPSPPEQLRVTFLDVGQGDATLIEDRHHAVLVDAGVARSGIEARLRELGIEELDLLVVTHADADHAGGVPDVLEDVDTELVLDGRDGVTSGADAALRAERTLPARAGQVLRLGDLTLRVLSPSPQTPGATNDRAIVLLVEAHGERVLLPADAESATLLPLPLPPVDVLKVSHHGSDDPGLPELLRRTRPQLAGIEVGEGNRYGHPTQSTVTALRAVPTVTRTDRDGTVRADLEDGRWVVRRSP